MFIQHTWCDDPDGVLLTLVGEAELAELGQALSAAVAGDAPVMLKPTYYDQFGETWCFKIRAARSAELPRFLVDELSRSIVFRDTASGLRRYVDRLNEFVGSGDHAGDVWTEHPERDGPFDVHYQSHAGYWSGPRRS